MAFFFLVGGLKVQPQVSVKQYIFYRLPSELILEPITGQLSHYAPLSHFPPRYAIKSPLTRNWNPCICSSLWSNNYASPDSIIFIFYTGTFKHSFFLI